VDAGTHLNKVRVVFFDQKAHKAPRERAPKALASARNPFDPFDFRPWRRRRNS